MIPQVLPAPPHLDIPKYIPNYSAQLLARPRHASSAAFLSDISQLVSSSVSPTQSNSPIDTADEDHIPSPHSPQGHSANFHYVNRASASFDSPISPSEMYDNISNSASYSAAPHSYSSVPASQENYNIHSGNSLRDSDPVVSYLSDSPSPVEAQAPTSFLHPASAPHSQDRFPPHHPPPSLPDRPDQQPSDRFSRNSIEDKLSPNTHPSSQLDHRRMSEPAILGSVNHYANPSSDGFAANRYQQFSYPYNPSPRALTSSFVPSLQRGMSMGSLRDLRHQQLGYSSQQLNGWKQEERRAHEMDFGTEGLDEPISPHQPNFSGGPISSPTSGLQYSPITENPYGASPPGTGTSTSSNPSALIRHSQSLSQVSRNLDNTNDPSSKTYSFVALPGNAVKKRPRRRYDEIERLYQCAWPDCTKAYGTLNHLNAHVTMQKHGSKRSPNEFKELRKLWRKAKKDSEPPVIGPLRRGSIGRHDDRGVYDSPRYGYPLHRHSQHLGLPSSLPIPHGGADERYSAALDELRYTLDENSDQVLDFARHRYHGSAPSSWHHQGRGSVGHQAYLSAGLSQNSHAHHSQLPQLTIQTQYSQTQSHSPTPQVAVNRLPPDSTLLTPLSSYHPPSLLPPLQTEAELGYPQSEGYVYDDEANRPGTGHGQASGDEYEQ